MTKIDTYDGIKYKNIYDEMQSTLMQCDNNNNNNNNKQNENIININW